MSDSKTPKNQNVDIIATYAAIPVQTDSLSNSIDFIVVPDMPMFVTTRNGISCAYTSDGRIADHIPQKGDVCMIDKSTLKRGEKGEIISVDCHVVRKTQQE